MKTTGYIGEDGKYHKGERKALAHDVNQTYKEWDHSMQRKEFAKEIIQPRKFGKPNPAFIKAYPDIAPEYFSEEQIKEAERTVE